MIVFGLFFPVRHLLSDISYLLQFAKGLEHLLKILRDILQKFNVQSFQGYYYAKPLMLDQFLDWCKDFLE